MAAVIESLDDERQRDQIVTFTWSDLLLLEAACCRTLQSCLQNCSLSEHSKCDARCVTVLLLPRSALLLASVLACMRLQVSPSRFMNSVPRYSSLTPLLQMPWVILNPLATPDDVARRVQALPCIVAACVTIEQCGQSALAAISLSGCPVLLLDRASESCPSHAIVHSSSPPEALPHYFTFTSGSSGSPQSVQCSGRSLWARLLTQLSPCIPLQGLVPARFRTLDRESLDWRELLNWCATASVEGTSDASAAGGSVCVWKTATEFCDTIVEMLQGVTYGVTQVVLCGDGSLSSRCSSVAAALCGHKFVANSPLDRHPLRFDVQRLFRDVHRHRVSHMTAVPSLIASLLALEESCCPLLHSVSGAQPAAHDVSEQQFGCLFQSLRVMGSSGEALHCSLVERVRSLLLRHHQAKLSLINVYGCAETTADACCIELKLPDDKCLDAWGVTAPLGEALQGSRIGVLMCCSGDSSPERQSPVPRAAALAPADISCASFRISWLHDAASPIGLGRIVVGGACVAKGYAQREAFLERLPELSRDKLATPPKSFFARVHAADADEDVPVFVTLDTAEIVTDEGGMRRLLYRGRQTSGLAKIRGVFVSLEHVEGAVQSIDPLHFVLAAEGSKWDCCARISVARAAFVDGALIVAVAFDFVVDSLGPLSPRTNSLSRFSSRCELHRFLCLCVQVVLRRQLRPESVPALHNISLHCTNILFPKAKHTDAVACCADVLPSRAPLLASGKLDFTAAWKSRYDAADIGCTGALVGASGLALAIASCVRDVLGSQAQVPIDANFFDVGVDSLTGTKLLVAVQALPMHCHRHIPFEALLQHPSASALASALSGSSSGAELLTCPPLVSHNHPSALSDEQLDHFHVGTLSSTRSSDFSHISTQDVAETRVIEWLPHASVRLWKMQNQDWACRITCSTSVTAPVAGGYSYHCKRLEQARWKIDLGACVDASPLIFALRAGEFGIPCKAAHDEFPIWPGFSVIAIVGSHAGLVVAAQVATGEVLWSVTLPDRVEPGASSAVLHPQSASVLVSCYDGCLYGLCVCKGVVKWRFDTNYACAMLSAAPSEQGFPDLSSAKRPRIAGKESLLNPDKEPLKGGVCLIDCSCCIASSSWSKCGALVGVAGYSKRFFAIDPASDGSVQKLFSCEVAGSVVAPLLSCHCCCSGGKSRVIAAATSGWLTCFSILNAQQSAKEWSIHLEGPLFSSPVCLVASRSPLVAVASATGQVFLVSVAHGHVQQRLRPLELPSSFMSAPRVVFSKESRVLMLLSSAGNAGILVFDCTASSVHFIARLTVPCAARAASFMSSPCVYRVDPLGKKSVFVALACASNGSLYAAAVDCDQLESLKLVCMSEIYKAGCGVFCSPSVLPALSRCSSPAPARADALMQLSLAVVMGGRDNMMRCLH